MLNYLTFLHICNTHLHLKSVNYINNSYYSKKSYYYIISNKINTSYIFIVNQHKLLTLEFHNLNSSTTSLISQHQLFKNYIYKIHRNLIEVNLILYKFHYHLYFFCFVSQKVLFYKGFRHFCLRSSSYFHLHTPIFLLCIYMFYIYNHQDEYRYTEQ